MTKKNKEFDYSLKLLAKTSIIVFIGLFLSKVLLYAYRIIIARHFGPEVYGLFSLSIMIIGWFISFSSLGLLEGILRYIPLYRGKKDTNKIKYIFQYTLVFILITSIIAGIILFLSAEYIALTFFNNGPLIIFLKYFAILIPVYILSSYYLSVIRAYEKISWFSFLGNILQNVIKVAGIFLFIFLGFKTNSVIFSYMLGLIVLLAGAYLVCKYKISEIFGEYYLDKKEKLKIKYELISYSWPLMFLAFIISIFHWIDSFAIGYYLGVSEVGIYNAAVPIAMLLYFAPELFMQLFFPMITKQFSKGNMKLIRELSKQVGKWIFILNIPVLLILIAFPGAIINILFGAQYIAASQALRILSIGVFFAAMFRISNDLLSMKGKSKLILGNIIIASALNIILNIILVPKYGINGAAFSTTLSYLLLGMMQVIEANYYLSIIPLKRKTINIVLVSLVPFFALFFIKKYLPLNLFSIIIQGSFFILLYLLLILATKSFDRNDWMVLKTIKHRLLN